MIVIARTIGFSIKNMLNPDAADAADTGQTPTDTDRFETNVHKQRIFFIE